MRVFRFVEDGHRCTLHWFDVPYQIVSETFETPAFLRSIRFPPPAEPAFRMARRRARELGFRGLDCDSMWRSEDGTRYRAMDVMR